jgi:hypothetical protein
VLDFAVNGKEAAKHRLAGPFWIAEILPGPFQVQEPEPEFI